MTPRLSIIIPCYNSARTLEEAVASCFTQELDTQAFEIILVDDGSTDTTGALMRALTQRYSNVKTLFHSENRGGGAARNTGIKESQGAVIFCLDSDNFFAPQSIASILRFIDENQLDGAAYFERRFFKGNNHSRYQTHTNTKLGSNIEITDIFSLKNNILLDNFFYTRSAYDKTAGYPEHHGFDTQCFELRFLAAGNRVQVVPESVFFHRQDAGQNSYFQRVYKQGYFSRNFYLICEDVIHLLSTNVRRLIIEFDVFKNTKLDSNNLKAKLDQHFEAHPDDFLIPEYQTYLTPTGRQKRKTVLGASSLTEDIFAVAVMSYHDGELEVARGNYTTLLTSGIDSVVIYFNLLRLHLASTKKYPLRRIDDDVQRLVLRLQPKPQTLSRFSGLVHRALHSMWPR